MKNLFLFIFFFISYTAFSKDYYVSASAGNNSNNGLSPTTPWQTIAKVNSFSFAANDNIYFKRGDTFYGGIIVKKAGLNFGAYGSGAKPIITGLSNITGWVNLGSNIWEAPVTGVKADVNLVMRDGTIQQVGRYPNIDAANGGYITYTAATSSSVTGAGLALATNWTGAEIAIRINRWDIIRQKVTAHSGTTVNFTINPEVPRVNYGCFFQRDPRTLDKDGEWWYDATNRKLRMYFSGNNPAAFSSLQIATVDTLFLNQYGNISVTNIAFNGSGKKAVWNHGGTNILIKDVDVNNSGAEAITAWFAFNVTIDGCSVENSLGSGIRVWNTSVGPKNLIVKNCTVNKTCLIAGMETTNVMNGGVGILCKGGSNVRVFNNTIKNSGYNGMEWQGDTARVYNNLVENFCSVRDDGAGIYTVETGNNSAIPQRYDRKVTSNIVINGIGARFGTPINTKTNQYDASVNGIYFDLGTRTVTADSNSIINVLNRGFHGNNNRLLTVVNNTVFNSRISYSTQRFGDAALVRDLVIKNNIFYPFRIEYRNLGINVPTLMTKEADLLALGDLNSNYYSTKTGTDTSIITVTTNNDLSNYQEKNNDFNYLKSTVGQEKNSINVPNTGTIEYNASGSIKTVFFQGLSKKDVMGKVYNDSATIPAWSSKILIPNGPSAVPNKVPVANAGIDKLITLPLTTLTLTGSASDSDGTIIKRQWVKLSGPAAGTIVSPDSVVTVLNNLAAGTYQFQWIVTDNKNAVAIDTVQVVVNIPPVANAGADISTTMPANTVTITGVATDADGSVSTIGWIKISGPVQGECATPSAATTVINNLVAGVHQFQLKVTDNHGAVTFDTVVITVNEPVVVSPLVATAIHGNTNCQATTTTVTITAAGGVGPYTGVGTFVTNAGKGSLKMSFPVNDVTKTTVLFRSVGQITAGKTYVLRFSTLGTVDNSSLKAHLRQSIAPYTSLAASSSNKVFGTSKQDHEVIFKPTTSDVNARLDLEIFQSAGVVYLDNISLVESTVTGELTGANLYPGGQFETGVSGMNAWSANNNQVITWDTSAMINNINYYTVTDAAGVTTTKAIEITQAATALKATATTTNIVGSGTATVVVNAIGGTAPYTGIGTFSKVKAGTYSYTVTDAKGCSVVTTISVITIGGTRIARRDDITDLATNKKFTVSCYPNPSSNYFNIGINGGSNEPVQVIVQSVDGRVVYQSTGATNKNYIIGNNFQAGMYIVKAIQGTDSQVIKIVKGQ